MEGEDRTGRSRGCRLQDRLPLPSPSRQSRDPFRNVFRNLEFPPVHALYVGQALSPANSTAEGFPTGIPISLIQPSCLSPGVWLAPSRGPGCRIRMRAHLYPRAEPSLSWTVKSTKLLSGRFGCWMPV